MYDLAIIGAGWAGFTACREAAQLGLRVCLIENNLIGGTCLNTGCIPTKTLVQTAKTLERARKAKTFGVSCEPVSFDLAAVQERKETVIRTLRQGMESQLSGVELFRQNAVVRSPQEIRLDDNTDIQARAVLLCTGSAPAVLPGFEFDGAKILSSDHALGLGRVPSTVLIIGGGVIGCEFAGILSQFGSKVTIAEACAQLVPGIDAEIARKLETALRKKSITVKTNCDAHTLDRSAYEIILVCVGRRPRSDAADALGLKKDGARIAVNEFLETSVPGVFAAGDCTGKYMLAHYAAYQGRCAAANIANRLNGAPEHAAGLQNIPSCIFTSPEMFSIGIVEADAALKGLKVTAHRFDFRACGMAQILGETDGMIKVVCEETTDRVIGAFIIGPDACELGGIFTVAVQSAMTKQELQKILFAHPSLSEAISETVR